ncbi:protein FAM180A-like [Brachionichthys hirsutus]|uniref:protein FAM180A-like n=1 Tax=Brachionichthys hirsutus TaxID=412623 RepID=UPI00360526A7
MKQVKIFFQVIFVLLIGQALKDVAAGKHPIPQNIGTSGFNANLMFEILLYGLEMDEDNNIVLLDRELASMRSGRAFLSQINDNIPRSIISMAQMVTMLKGESRRPLTQDQYERLILATVYSAHQAQHQEQEEQEAWGGVLLQLANITVQDLRGSFLFSYA